MEVIILVGSGHINSTCNDIAKEVRKFLNNKNFNCEVIQLAQCNISDCLGCDYCKAHQNVCVIKDQMQELYKKINNSDLLIFVTPVYFSNFPATIKKVIDRGQLYFNLENKDIIKEKNFIGIHIGGAKPYSSQFEAFEITYKVFLPNIKVKKTDFINISNTDQINPFKNKSILEEIINKVNNFVCLEYK